MMISGRFKFPGTHKAIALLTAVTLGFWATGDATAESLRVDGTRYHFSSYLPSTHLTNVALQDFFVRVEAGTSNPKVWKMYTGGLMGKAIDTLPGVEERIVDSGIIVDAYTPWALRGSMMLSNVSLLGTDAMSMTAAINEVQLRHCSRCLSDFSNASIVPLAFYATAPYNLICSVPVQSEEQLRGIKVRATGATARTLEFLGATPVNIPTNEMYEGLQRGQIDCIAGSVAWLRAYSLMDVSRYVLKIPLGTYHGVNVFNLNSSTAAQLDAETRDVIRRELPGLLSDIVVAYSDEELIAVEDATLAGIEFLEPDATLLARLDEHRQSEVRLAAEYGERYGISNAPEILSELILLVREWDQLLIDEGRSPEAYRRLLSERIFRKLSFTPGPQ